MEDQLETLRASAAKAQQSAQEADRLKEEAEAQAKKEVERARQEAAQIVQKTRQRADAWSMSWRSCAARRTSSSLPSRKPACVPA